MSHNPATTDTVLASRCYALQRLHILQLQGPDAMDFAHRQFMNDVAGLASGHWHWNGWLTPKGRVIALFALLKFDAQQLWLLLLDAGAAELASQLQRFVFRSKLTVRVADELHVAGALSASRWASGAHFTSEPNTAVELDLSTPHGGRSLHIVRDLPVSLDGFDATWAAQDLLHGLPRLPASQREQWTPQQLSLGRLDAYSVKKGCYPGQEIVARTHFLGQAKRELVLLQTDVSTPVAVATPIHDASGPIGTVISAAATDTEQYALAVLPSVRTDPLHLGDNAGPVLPQGALLPGLAR